jgi:hypothetical protein
MIARRVVCLLCLEYTCGEGWLVSPAVANCETYKHTYEHEHKHGVNEHRRETYNKQTISVPTRNNNHTRNDHRSPISTVVGVRDRKSTDEQHQSASIPTIVTDHRRRARTQSSYHTAHAANTQHTARSTQHTSPRHTYTLADMPDDLALTCGKDHNCSSTEYTTPSTLH